MKKRDVKARDAKTRFKMQVNQRKYGLPKIFGHSEEEEGSDVVVKFLARMNVLNNGTGQSQ